MLAVEATCMRAAGARISRAPGQATSTAVGQVPSSVNNVEPDQYTQAGRASVSKQGH